MRWCFLALSFSMLGCEYYDKPNRPMPADFEARRADGSLLRVEDLKGKPWVISIWAPGCHLCAGELPDIEKLRLKYESQGIGFLSLSLIPERRPNEKFLKELNVQMPWVMAEGEVLHPLAVNQIPSTVFLNKDAVIVRAARGQKSARSLEKQVRNLLAAE
jgi:thiol-disulfide isomerase/thioredoxin